MRAVDQIAYASRFPKLDSLDPFNENRNLIMKLEDLLLPVPPKVSPKIGRHPSHIGSLSLRAENKQPDLTRFLIRK